MPLIKYLSDGLDVANQSSKHFHVFMIKKIQLKERRAKSLRERRGFVDVLGDEAPTTENASPEILKPDGHDYCNTIRPFLF